LGLGFDLYSAWWGQSFVSELHRISEQAEKKLKVRQGSSVDFTLDRAAIQKASNKATEPVQNGTEAANDTSGDAAKKPQPTIVDNYITETPPKSPHVSADTDGVDGRRENTI
jgi:hypothetical protein